MLSRLAIRGVFQVGAGVGFTRSAASTIVLRAYASDSHAVVGGKPHPGYDPQPKPGPLDAVETIENWDAANKVYFGPERDLANFPIVKLPIYTPPARLGFIPDSWFQFMYEKTGVTGPYLLGVGLTAFVLSKEIWITDHNFYHFVSFWLAFTFFAKKYGQKIGEYLDERTDGFQERFWDKPMRKNVANAEKTIKEAETFIWQEAGQKYLFEAKRENVDLQLEAAYRQRLAQVHQAVKKRLDYQMDVENVQRRIHQQHMVQWIVDQVVKGITPQQEKDSLAKCIQDLKTLAAQRPATAAV